MLLHHLLSGLIIGMLAMMVGLLHGHSIAAAIGYYIIGANVGLGVSVLGALSSRRTDASQLTSVARQSS